MNDRELLELAAKAAGYAVVFNGDYCPKWKPSAKTGRIFWNPLTDDGDALRLAVKLSINMEHMRTMGGDPFGFSCWPIGRGDCGANETDIADYGAAVRRAITRAAAEIARAADAGGKE